jgi:hypothetical protein
MFDPWTLGGHATIIALLVWVVMHIRSIRIEMRNGGHRDESSGDD